MVLGFFALTLLALGVVLAAVAILELFSHFPLLIRSRRIGVSLLWLVGMLLIGGLLLVEDGVRDWTAAWFSGDSSTEPRGPIMVSGPAKGFLIILLAVPLLYGLKFFICYLIACTWIREYSLPRGLSWFVCIASFYLLYSGATWLEWSGRPGPEKGGSLFAMLIGRTIFHSACWSVIAWLWLSGPGKQDNFGPADSVIEAPDTSDNHVLAATSHLAPIQDKPLAVSSLGSANSSPMVHYRCPSCNREYESVRALAGLTVVCRNCKHPIEIPRGERTSQELASIKPAVANNQLQQTGHAIGGSSSDKVKPA
jgi:hypothetical protein